MELLTIGRDVILRSVRYIVHIPVSPYPATIYV